MELYLYFDIRSILAETYLVNRENFSCLERTNIPDLFNPAIILPIKDGFISIDWSGTKCIRKDLVGVRLETIDYKYYSRYQFQALKDDFLIKNTGEYESVISFDGKKVFVTNRQNKFILLDLEKQTVLEPKSGLGFGVVNIFMTQNLLITGGQRFSGDREFTFYNLNDFNYVPIYLAPQGIGFQNFTLERALSSYYLEKAYQQQKSKNIPCWKMVIHNHQDYLHIFDPTNREEKGLILIPYRGVLICYHCQRFSLLPPSSVFVFNTDSYQPFSRSSSGHLRAFTNSAYQLCPRLYLRNILNVYRLIVSLCRKQRYYDRDVCDLIFKLCYPIFEYNDMLLFRRYINGEITLKELFPRH